MRLHFFLSNKFWGLVISVGFLYLALVHTDSQAQRLAPQATALVNSADRQVFLPIVSNPANGAATTPIATPTPSPEVTGEPTATPTLRPLLDPTFGNNGRVVTRQGDSFGVDLTTVGARQSDGKLIGGNGHVLFRVTPLGALDPTFGDGGFVTLSPTIYDLSVQTDDKLIVSGLLGAGNINDFIVARYLPNGALDRSFAEQGVLRLENTDLVKFESAWQTIQQPDGKLLVLGRLPHPSNDIAALPVLLRLLPTGAFDPTFADAGKHFFIDPTFPYLHIYTMALQPDGKIVVGGDTGTGNESTQAVLLRLQPDGSPDPTFAQNGQLVTDFGAQLNGVSQVQFQPDGKLVVAVAGSYGVLSRGNFDLVRLLPNGAMDTAFGNHGHATLDLQDPQGESVNTVAILPDEKILVTGNLRTDDDPVVMRWNSNGTLDTTLDGNGWRLLNPPQDHRLASFTAFLQPDGKLVLAGTTYLFQNQPHQLALVRLTNAGAFDPTFAAAGQFLFSPGNSGANAVAVQPDGKILVGGYTSHDSKDAVSDWALLRYNPDGALDPTFNGAGEIITGFNSIRGNAWIKDLTLQPDGKIVVAGRIDGPQEAASVVRYNVDGALDPTFGAQGVLSPTLALMLDETRHPLALQPDGKMVVGGNRYIDSKDSFSLVRLLPDGALDPTFGNTGQVTTAFDQAAQLKALALQPDGKIVAVGYFFDRTTYASAFVILRYTPDGALDTGFHGDGKVFTPFKQTTGAYTVAVQPDGKIVAAGSADADGSGNWDFALVRYLPDGTLDATFGQHGVVFTDFPPGNHDEINALLLRSDGKMVAGGYTEDWSKQEEQDFALVRYNPDGSIDSGFHCGANVRTDLGTPVDKIQAIALQPDGKIIAAGYNYYTIAVARYLANGPCIAFR
ncbi:MAG: hypothetical protein U0350_10275 [Caldilineaceae bacterium]